MSTIKHSQISALLVDDDAKLCGLLRDYLEGFGFSLDVAEDASSGLEKAVANEYDVILLDMMLPDINGLQVLLQLQKQRPALPVIMLTGLGSESDVVVGLEMGADDYVVKPFVARELLARIKAIMRRFRTMPPNLQVTEAGRLVEFGDWQLDTVARHLIDPEGTIVALSGAEYRLLRVFLDHPQRVLTRDQLLNLTQGRDAELFERSIDLLVSRVRQRLNEDARTPAYIKTVRSEGYVFTMPVTIKEVNE